MHSTAAVGVILRKEVSAFFGSLVAYVVLVVFLAFNGLFFWVFQGNVLETGLAELTSLFFFTPWLFLLLIPAITMRAFAEEFRQGTYELLVTKPLTVWQIIFGKYLATVVLVMAALLPTLVYYGFIWYLGNPKGNLDTGATWGAYIGLVLIGSTFAAVGVWTSALTSNQIVAFILGSFICFFLYTGFGYLAQIPSLTNSSAMIDSLGMVAHYESISRGVVDSRDLLYFLSLSVFFLVACRFTLAARRP